jgi:hypothetical protein
MASYLTLRSYYSDFKSARGISTAIGVILPVIPKVKGGTWTEYLLAPLGDVDIIARILLAVFCIAMTYLVYFFFQGQSHKARKRTLLLTLFFIPFSCACLYLVLCMSFVRNINIPTLERSAYVSVGFQRTSFARQTFDSMTDEEMLRSRGLDDEEIRKLWTPLSLVVTRVALFMAWSGIALSLICGLSLGLLDQTEIAVARKEESS